jgi:hypothetical protein
MTDLTTRFRSYDTIRPPEYWADVLARASAEPASSAEPPRRWLLPVALALLLVGLIGGAVLLSADLLPTPGPSESPVPTESDNPAPSDEAGEQLGVVAYGRAGRIWVVNTDGTDPRQLVPFELDPEKPRMLDTPDIQYPLAWSPDGTRLYYRFERTESRGPDDGIGEQHGGVAVTDAAGSAPVDLLDVVGSTAGSSNGWCPAPVEFDNCQANLDEMVISPDGTRLAYPIQEGRELNTSTIVVVDVASGQSVRLDSTRTENPGSLSEGEGGARLPCTSAHGGYNRAPQWSPDGSQLLFYRFECRNALFTIDPDGTDLREVFAMEGEFFPQIISARWSPDGSSILLYTSDSTLDIATVRPDGSGLQALTDDGISIWPFWTRDGRIVFERHENVGERDMWVMNGDGGNAMQLAGTVLDLTEVGCIVCRYPVAPSFFQSEGDSREWLWQPAR